MKNLFIAVILLTAIGASAQPFEKSKRPDFTPSQIAELQTKKMTLELELTKNQQQQILEINKRNAIERKQIIEKRKDFKEKGVKPNSDELFKIRSAQLDNQIALQNKMKTILNEQQFKAWKKNRTLKKMHLKRKAKKRKMQKHLKNYKR